MLTNISGWVMKGMAIVNTASSKSEKWWDVGFIIILLVRIPSPGSVVQPVGRNGEEIQGVPQTCFYSLWSYSASPLPKCHNHSDTINNFVRST